MEDKKNCVFLVDDSPINLNTGMAVLQGKYTVVTMSSGEKLLRMLEKTIPDLILLDVEMPEMSGYDTIKKIKSNTLTAEIPVIFLTAKSEPENELLGLSLGAVDYIIKPFSPPLLLKRIELHLLLQSQKNELRKFNENLTGMVKERTNDIAQLQNAIILWAAEMVEFRDEETGQHVERVQKYLELLLEAMGKMKPYADEVATWDIEAFLKSAPLHDVGKIKIRDNILLKNSRLTDDEFTNMKLHAQHGKMLLESLQQKVPNHAFLDYAKTLAYSHHEKWDGSGYPEGLKAQEIPLQARMMALADVYDALVSERPYKKAFTHEDAIQIISEGRGIQFDPDLADLFISLSLKIKEISCAGKGNSCTSTEPQCGVEPTVRGSPLD
ncbi:MAG: response regulator [Treponema sp.]|jgi:putative two-component system response regulator|nr:response regulator [Treponema sp.]